MDERSWRADAEAMVRSQIEARGVRDPTTLRALAAVPRHRFIPAERREFAYSDGAVPIGSGQTISQPFIVAQMTAALELSGGERVLEIGTGSGYQTAVLAEAVGAAGEVYTVERHQALSSTAQRLLERLGYRRVHFAVGDGTLGWPEFAPYGAIIVTAAGPFVPDRLRDQLDPDGGRLVIPVGDRTQQQLLCYTLDGERWTENSLGPVAFVPLIGEQGWAEGRG